MDLWIPNSGCQTQKKNALLIETSSQTNFLQIFLNPGPVYQVFLLPVLDNDLEICY